MSDFIDIIKKTKIDVEEENKMTKEELEHWLYSEWSYDKPLKGSEIYDSALQCDFCGKYTYDWLLIGRERVSYGCDYEHLESSKWICAKCLKNGVDNE